MSDQEMMAFARQYATTIELDKAWSRVEVDHTTDGDRIGFAIWYKGQPSHRTVVEDTTHMVRTVLMGLMARGKSPAADDISVSVMAYAYQQGETGQMIPINLGRARYSPYEDNIEFKNAY